MFGLTKRLMKSECGVTAIEYGLIIALATLAAINALTSLGGNAGLS